ncbi:MAG: hypothetical protein KAI59_05350 [Planctomycetes bacterium]|nr:hypothetical protein [Planctomycetota bacterium]MCK5473438.1 hypothetical protein [Planctomycetota bacterium]
MTITSEKIEKVRAFEVPNGVFGDGQIVSAAKIAFVKWQSGWSDKFYQVYVNGKYAGATSDNEQRHMLVQIPDSPQTAVKIEVFAVEAQKANVDFSDEVGSVEPDKSRVCIQLLRSQVLPLDSFAEIYSDNGSGEIDYENPINNTPIKIWPSWQSKAGFAMSKFGLSDFGYDSSAAIGFGKGFFGYGQFGIDADYIEWLSEQLPAGTYKFGVKIISKNGNKSSSVETGQITIIPAAKPAEHLAVVSFDKQNNKLIFNVS